MERKAPLQERRGEASGRMQEGRKHAGIADAFLINDDMAGFWLKSRRY